MTTHTNFSCSPYAFAGRGFVRLRDILAPTGPIPVSRSSWWAGVKAGKYPSSVKLGPRTTAWRVEDIERLINELPLHSAGDTQCVKDTHTRK